MAIPHHSSFCSKESLASTILVDRQSYVWFKHLITRKNLRKKLSTGKINDLYKTFDQICLLQNLLSVGSIGILIYAFFSSLKIILITLAPLYVAFVLCHFRKKKCVSRIGLNLIEQEFDMTKIGRYSLYQICEQLSRKFSFPSFVSSIQTTDNYYRITLIIICLSVIFIYPMNHVWQIFLILFTGLSTIYFYTDSNYFFNTIK